MLRIPIENVSTGMVLARSVVNPSKMQHVLLKAGFALDDETIDKLRKLRVHSCWVKYPNLDFLDDVLDPELVNQQQEIYSTLKDQFTEAQNRSLAKIDYNIYVKQVSALFARMLSQKNGAMIYINDLHGHGEDIFLHGTNVAYLALLIGMRLESYLLQQRPQLPPHLAMDLTGLGVGCLLHDIGKLSLPEELREFHLTAQNHGDPAWRQHTELGFDMVRGGLDPCSAQVILNHHQHFDGSGFPVRKSGFGTEHLTHPLKGEEIHIFCRIAAIADRFEGFRHLPDGRIAPTVVAMKRMLNKGYVKWFDPLIYSAFLETVPPFPPGEQVFLNTGQPAVVTELNEGYPCRPIVRYIDPELAKAPEAAQDAGEPTEVNLALRRDLSIARIGNFDVTDYLYETKPKSQPLAYVGG
jgi:HD-GYP domain-containing protein (c-di-GMP phosphodiesterase class II)